MFYVSKYYELLDTLLLLLKKRKPTAVQVGPHINPQKQCTCSSVSRLPPPPFLGCTPLQIWHHASVLFLFWGAMNSRAANQYWFAINNTFCHVFV